MGAVCCSDRPLPPNIQEKKIDYKQLISDLQQKIQTMKEQLDELKKLHQQRKESKDPFKEQSHNAQCSHCNIQNIQGHRFKCIYCDYNACENCFINQPHQHKHFVEVTKGGFSIGCTAFQTQNYGKCDSCKQGQVNGRRFTCQSCQTYYCEICFSNIPHEHELYELSQNNKIDKN